MVTAICFFDDVQKAFNEAYRILKPDGFIIIGFIDRNSPLGQMYEQKKDTSKFYNEAIFYSVNEVTEYLKKAGFKSFIYKQTIFGTENIIYPVLDEYGKGSFVVVKADKS